MTAAQVLAQVAYTQFGAQVLGWATIYPPPGSLRAAGDWDALAAPQQATVIALAQAAIDGGPH